MTFDFNARITKRRLMDLAEFMQDISNKAGFKMSARGWCYQMEQLGLIQKNEFGKVEDAINACRRQGFIPVDFVAEEDARSFKSIFVPSEGTVVDKAVPFIDDVLNAYNYFIPDYWEGQDYYIQIVVEKVDLVSLFLPICQRYRIPIANSKGWSSVLQRAEYARRFADAEENGLTSVLLYCGDHDPDGLRISDTLRSNLNDVKDIVWSDGHPGYDPENLIIERFGLNYDFIVKNNLSWIDNLMSGRGKDLASPKHKNHRLPYMQNYIRSYGPRKCEANAVVVIPDKARQLLIDKLHEYLPLDYIESTIRAKDRQVKQEYELFLETSGLGPKLIEIKEKLEEDGY